MLYICQNPACTSYSSHGTSDNVSELGIGMRHKKEQKTKKTSKSEKERKWETEGWKFSQLFTSSSISHCRLNKEGIWMQYSLPEVQIKSTQAISEISLQQHLPVECVCECACVCITAEANMSKHRMQVRLFSVSLRQSSQVPRCPVNTLICSDM